MNGQAREYLRVMLFICSYYLIGKSINSTVVAGIFCAGGDTKFGMCCDAVTMWVVIVPVGGVGGICAQAAGAVGIFSAESG